MKKRRGQTLWVLLFLATLGLWGCATNGGIEAGNPDLKGKSIILRPKDSETSFVVRIADDNTAEVSEIAATRSETVSVPYDLAGLTISLSAGFSDETKIDVSILFNEVGDIQEVQLAVNGSPTPTGVEPGPPSNLENTNAALLIDQAFCARIVDCNSVFARADCEANVLQVPGLASDFGGGRDQTLAQAADAIDSNNRSIDAATFQDCLAAITALSCETIQKNFNDTDPPVYNRIRNLVPKPICAKGFLASTGAP